MTTFIVVLLFFTVGVSHGRVFEQEPVGFVTREPTFTKLLEPAENGFRVNGEMTDEGICLCTVQQPAEILCTDYQAKKNSEKLQDIQHKISKLAPDVKQLHETTTRHAELFAAFESNLTEVTSTFDLIEGGQMLVTRVEIEGVLTRIRHMQSTLFALREWHGIESEAAHMGKIQVMLDEASNITRIVDAMASEEFIDGAAAAIQREISSLTDRLKSCTDQATAGDRGSAGAERESPADSTTTPPTSDTLPELWPAKEKQNTCGRLVGISEPYTLRGSLGSKGTWMRDPILNPEFVYFHTFLATSSRSSSTTTQFKTSSSVKSFQRDETHQITGEVTHHIVESVVYNGSIFAYSSESTSRYSYYRDGHRQFKLIGINLSHTSPSFPAFTAGDVSQERAMTATQLEQASYRPTTVVPKMDLTVDETGLWLLYGDSLGMLTVSQVDQTTLEFNRTLRGAYPKNRLGNCFVVCGKVYCLNSYTEFDSKVSYFMDTETGFEGFTNVPFIIKYGSLSSIEYNPRDQMLYGWDNEHAVVYSMTFE
ncbi:noelin-like [Patiria miniata]|uniref:Olfactomedin-like domain-containing protein n=1 Tax=Patiria miniata TaxID=46514 RepID=A0A913ZF34_PATMI|nr:noelin-like [Patiria miniata]